MMKSDNHVVAKNGDDVLVHDNDVSSIRQKMTEIHDSRINFTEEWRRENLLTLKRMVVENKTAFIEAIYKDLHRHPVETESAEFACLVGEIDCLISSLKDYHSYRGRSDDGAVTVPASSPLFLSPCFSYVRYEPLLSPGVLVIAPFNYPMMLSLAPAAGSIAAGNPTVIKMSELSPHTSSLMKNLVSMYFDDGGGKNKYNDPPPPALTIVEGGVKETTELLDSGRWGMIFFTGSTMVGKIIAKKAAETFTPVIMELGGKSPVYISEQIPNNDMSVVADRIAWGKLLNAGQTCVAPDHVFCHRSQIDHFCDEIIKSIKRMTGNDACADNKTDTFSTMMDFDELPRIINEVHAERLISSIKEIEEDEITITDDDDNNNNKRKGKIIFGGSKYCDAKSKLIVPTVVINPAFDTKLMTEEIFGPILPICCVSSDDEAVRNIHKMQELNNNATPLALYCFTSNNDVFERISTQCRSGTLVRNDVVVQFSSSYLPIGGLGTSGQGAYHGKYSIETFSHKRATICRPMNKLLSEYGGVRYGPYYDNDEATTADSVKKNKSSRNNRLKSQMLILLTSKLTMEVPVLCTTRLSLLLLLALLVPLIAILVANQAI